MRSTMLLILAGCKGGVAGDARLTEFYDDGTTAWVEISQLHRTEGRDLGALTLVVDGQQIDLPSVRLESGETFVVGNLAGADLEAAFQIPDNADLQLEEAGEVLHLVELDQTWPRSTTSSVSRDPEASDGRDAWCMTWEALEEDSFSSPGVLNGSCSCRMVFDFRYVHVDDPALDVAGTEEIVVAADGSFLVPGQAGEAVRSSDAFGQHLGWAYQTGIQYDGTRPFGQADFIDQPIQIPADNTQFVSGSWSTEGGCL